MGGPVGAAARGRLGTVVGRFMQDRVEPFAQAHSRPIGGASGFRSGIVVHGIAMYGIALVDWCSA